MITLITGTPGAGKTLYAVQLLLDAVKSGRPCYADINGLSVPGVQTPPDDWRECPEGSFILFDEAQRRWPSTGKPGRSGVAQIEALDTHRHGGYDFVLTTQQPTLVHHEVRGYCADHRHIVRLSGAQSATVYRWQAVCTSPNDRQEKDQADSSVWRYPKELYSFYKSSSLHTSAYRFRMPAKLKLILGASLLICAAVIWRISESDGMLGFIASGGERGGSEAPTPPALVTPFPNVKTVTSDGWFGAVGGCIASQRACRCYDTKGQPLLEVDDGQCRAYVVNPLYQPVRLSSGKGDA